MPSGQRGSGGQAEWQITDTRHPVQPCWLLSRHTHGVWLQTLPRSTRPGRPQPPAALGRAEIWTGTHNLPPKPASLSGLLASARPPGWLRSTAGSLDHGKGRINLGRLFWGWDFQPFISWWLCQRWESRQSQPGGRALPARRQHHPKLPVLGENKGIFGSTRSARTLTCWWASCSTCCWCRLARKSWCCSCCVCFRASRAVSEPGLTTRCPMRRSMGAAWGTRGEVHGFTAAVETQSGVRISTERGPPCLVALEKRRQHQDGVRIPRRAGGRCEECALLPRRACHIPSAACESLLRHPGRNPGS